MSDPQQSLQPGMAALPIRAKDDKEPDADVISLASSVSSVETTIADLHDLDIDADTLLSTLETLLTLQHDAVRGLLKLQRAANEGAEESGGDEIVNTGVSSCKKLYKSSTKLQQMIKTHVAPDGRFRLRLKTTYEKDFQPSSSIPRKSVNESDEKRDRGPEVSAAAFKWSSDCMVTMLGLSADVELLVSQQDKEKDKGEADEESEISDTESWVGSVDHDELEDSEMVVTLHRYAAPLESLTQRVSDILELIDDIIARPAHLTPASNPVLSGASYSYRDRERPDFSGSSIVQYPRAQQETPYFRLRKELYALKDHLKETRNLVYMIRSVACARDAGVNTSRLRPPMDYGDIAGSSSIAKQCYADVKAVEAIIEELLSNNGEDWLTSLEKGGMSFDTFQCLDLDWIISIKTRIISEDKRLRQQGTKLNASHVAEPLLEVLREALVLFNVPEPELTDEDLRRDDGETPPADDKIAGFPDPADYENYKVVEQLAILGDW